MKMAHGLKMQALKLNTILISVLFSFILISVSQAKTLKVDTVTPSVTDGNFTITPNGTGDIVIGSGSGFVKLTSGILSNQELIDVASEVSGVLPIANGGTGSATQNFVDLTTAQTVSGVKTLSDLLDANAGADIEGNMTLAGNLTMEGTGALKLPEGTTAQQPAGADGMIRFNSDLDRFEGYKESAAAWGEIGGGGAGDVSGVGGINYLADNNDSDFEISVSNWVAFDDGSVTVPVDGTGGSPTLTCTRNTTTPIRGDGDLQVTTPAADSQGEGCSVDFDIDKGMQAQKLTISAWYDLSGVDDDDFAIFVYDKTNTNLIRVNGEDLKAGKGVLYAQFQAASNSTAYRLIIMNVDSSNTTARNLYLDQIAVSPTRLARGGILTQSVLANGGSTGSSSTVSNYTIQEQKGTNLLTNSSGVWTVNQNNTTVTASITGVIGTTDSRVNVKFTIDGTSYDAATDSFDSGSGYVVSATATQVLNKGDSLEFNTLGSGNVSNIVVTFSASSQGGTASEDLGGGEVVARYSRNDTSTVSAEGIIVYEDLIQDSTASYNSSTGEFTVPSTGKYLVTASIRGTVTGSGFLEIYYDGSIVSADIDDDATGGVVLNNSVVINAVKGKIIDVRNGSGNTFTPNGNSQYNQLSIVKLATGSQKFETATVAARYSTNAGQSISSGSSPVISYEDLDYDTNNMCNGAGVCTIPISGKYQINVAASTEFSSAFSSGSAVFLTLRINSTDTSTDAYYAESTASQRAVVSVSEQYDLVKGDTIDAVFFQNTGSSINLDSSSQYNNFSIHRIK